MAADTGPVSRRRYLCRLGALGALAGCAGDDGSERSTPTGTARRTPGSTNTATSTVEPWNPDDPLADRYGVLEREATYRETADGPLSVVGALPDGTGPFPLVVHVHGGAWRYGTPDYGAMDLFARAGIAVASVEYRLSGTATYPAAVRDVVACVQWLRANAADWTVDPDRVTLMGGSAGGHLSALVAAAPNHQNFQPEGTDADESVAVDAVVPHYGIFDLRGRDACENRNTSAFFGEDCSNDDVVAEASPITHVDGDHPPVQLFHGDDDQLIPVEQSRQYRDALQSAGVQVEYHELPGVGHGYLAPEDDDQREIRLRTHRRMVTYLLQTVWDGQQ